MIIIQTTYPSLAKAKKVAKNLLAHKLAACVQFSKITSVYSWKGELQNNKEVLVSIKTLDDFYEPVKKLILATHDYKTPELIVLKVEKASEEYSDWVNELRG